MFQAQLLINKSTAVEVWSPWMQRGGDNIRFQVEMVDLSLTSGALGIQIYTKNSEDTGNPATGTGTEMTLSSATIETQEVTGLKELVRYKFRFTGTNAGDWTLFRVLEPVWFDDVKA